MIKITLGSIGGNIIEVTENDKWPTELTDCIIVFKKLLTDLGYTEDQIKEYISL
ncbi:MAG: hypothetical protein ACFFDY_01420 [Candidatus Thorarchaeota archaeon]